MVLCPADSLLLVAEHGAAQPSLRALDTALAAPGGVGLDLVLINLAHREVLGLGVREDERRDGGSGQHHVGLRELELVFCEAVDIQQIPQRLLLAVVGLRGVARRGPNALVPDLEHVLEGQVLVLCIAPERGPDLEVDKLREGLGQAVGHSLEKDGAVYLALVLKDLPLLVATKSASAGKTGNVVGGYTPGSDEVALAPVCRLAHVQLLPQAKELARGIVARLVCVDLDVIPHGVCRPNADDRGALEDAVLDNPVEHFLGLLEELGGLLAHSLVLEDSRIVAVGVLTTELVDLEERRPINVLDYLFDRVVLDAEVPNELGLRRDLCPVNRGLHPLSLGQSLPLLVHESGIVLFADLRVLVLDVVQVTLLLTGHTGAHHGATAGSVQHVNDAVIELRGDLHSSVALRRCGTANHEGHLHATGLHLLRHVDHLIQRGRDETGKANYVHSLLFSLFKDLVTRDHHTHVNDLEVVAAKHHADNVLANVVHIALDSGHEHDSVPLGLVGIFTLFDRRLALLFLHEGREVRHSLLHDTGALDDLRQEHLPCPEEVANDAHALHQRTLDDLQRDLEIRSRLLNIPVDELVDAVDQPMVQPLCVGAVAPSILALRRSCPRPAGGCGGRGLPNVLRELEETLDVLAVSRLVEDDLLAEPTSARINVRVSGQAARVHDGHVQALGDRVVQEYTMHSVPQRVEAAEGEREVAEASAEGDARASALDLSHSVDEVSAVGVMLWEPCGNGQHIAVKNDVLGIEVQLGAQKIVTPRADADLVFEGCGLTLLIERHDDNCGAEALAEPRLPQELFFTDLQ
mmetsp:Transcript_96377/g.297191  ORF Transcript_96377/g.297191 Transcript_96377/m.297191 type:complete len:805 (+) Transcript_96377:124-2538(+)